MKTRDEVIIKPIGESIESNLDGCVVTNRGWYSRLHSNPPLGYEGVMS